jgi:hypothetical protein
VQTTASITGMREIRVGSAHDAAPLHIHIMSPLKGFGAVTAACFTSGLAGVLPRDGRTPRQTFGCVMFNSPSSPSLLPSNPRTCFYAAAIPISTNITPCRSTSFLVISIDSFCCTTL